MKRPHSHTLEDQALRRIAGVFSSQGWTVERIVRDYGEDLLVRIFEGGESTPFLFFVQAKAYSSANRLRIKEGQYLSVPVEPKHIASWRGFREPVILTVWDSEADEIYWQVVQTALAVADRRAEWRNVTPTRARVWIPVKNQLDEVGVKRIASRARAAWEYLEREREGARILVDTLREQLGLDIAYDAGYGVIEVPEGIFTPDAAGNIRVHHFGRAAQNLRHIARDLGVSEQQAFTLSVDVLLIALAKVLGGEPAVFRGKDGQLIELWKDTAAIGENFLAMLEQSDDD